MIYLCKKSVYKGKNMSSNKDVNEYEKYLEEPFALEFSEYTRKVRNNLMIVGVLSIILVTQNLALNTNDSSILGLKFENLDMNLIFTILFFLNIYSLIHFSWLTMDSFNAWRLKLTIGNKIYQGTYEDLANIKKNPSQSTLYSWWLGQIKSINNEKKNVDIIEDELGKFIVKLKENPPEGEKIGTKLNEIEVDVKSFKKSFESYHNLISNQQIPASLERFDKRFQYIHSSQNWRWIIIEFFIPISIGLFALFSLFQKLYL